MNDDYELSDACEMPQQPPLLPADAKHPLYTKYLEYRAAMTRQLVQAPSFDTWLRWQDDD